jgi:uncharacterized membrane protein YoaK (UPF0700 family)
MFRHKGKTRNLNHNIGIASLLSFVAGIVNVVGFLAVQKLTTNVTGHFAFMVKEAFLFHFNQALFYFIYIFFFLFGAFCSNFIIEITHKVTKKNIFVIPVLIEAILLLIIALLNFNYIVAHPNLIACFLLFSMGLQNSLVTTISNSVVRTTHLTGLFTDLGIEISQLFFYKTEEQRLKLFSSIKLRITIITTFFMGGILAALFYSSYKMKTLLIASLILIIGLFIDYINVKLDETK